MRYQCDSPPVSSSGSENFSLCCLEGKIMHTGLDCGAVLKYPVAAYYNSNLRCIS